MKFAQLWVPLFLHYIEGFVLKTCGKITEKYWFYRIFKRFWRVFVVRYGYWNRYGLYADCKSWKEKVFVLRGYGDIFILICFVCVLECLELLQSKRIVFCLNYTRIAERKQAAEKRIEKNFFRFYYRKCVLFECEKIV